MKGPCLLLVSLLLPGCALRTRATGLVEEGPPLRLESLDGRSYRLWLDVDARPVAGLDGCQVELSGSRLGRWLWVRDWEVLAALDGSTPFVGRLEQHGSRLILRDRVSGPLVLDAEAVPELAERAGALVLVIGYVVGDREVRVVAWRALPE